MPESGIFLKCNFALREGHLLDATRLHPLMDASRTGEHRAEGKAVSIPHGFMVGQSFLPPSTGGARAKHNASGCRALGLWLVGSSDTGDDAKAGVVGIWGLTFG